MARRSDALTLLRFQVRIQLDLFAIFPGLFVVPEDENQLLNPLGHSLKIQALTHLAVPRICQNPEEDDTCHLCPPSLATDSKVLAKLANGEASSLRQNCKSFLLAHRIGFLPWHESQLEV